MYDESIEVYEEDDNDDEYEQVITGRGRPGVSPVRRQPFQKTLQQRPSRSFVRNNRQFNQSESLDMSTDEGSPAPPAKEEEGKGKKLSAKDFTPQQSAESSGGKPENLISMASSYAKKLMSSGSDKKKEKPPPDVAEVSKREQKAAPPPEQKKSQNAPPPATKPQQHKPPPATKKSKSEDEDDDDEDDDEYDDVNLAQIEGLLNRVELSRPPSAIGLPLIPQPPPGTPPPYAHRRPFHAAPLSNSASALPPTFDRGGAGDPYSARPSSTLPQRPQTVHPGQLQQQSQPYGFQHGCGPSTSSLMRSSLSDDDYTDTEMSAMESDMVDYSRMEHIMDMYGAEGHATMDPQLMMAIPAPDLNNIAVMDDEIMENMVTHRRMWEYSLDLKREKLRRRTLVMSDYVGVHAPDYDVYNPQDYEHLNVSPEIKELFHYITRYEPPIVGTQMDVKLKPFIPEYYPSVGDIDAFIKVQHPDVQDEALGIKHLDEPSPFQSDPSVLDLRLRALAKQSSSKSVTVKKIDNVGKNSKIIENWIKDISDLHRSKPSPSVHYSKPMPDIDSLIQEWPPQIEDLLKNISLPSSELDCDLPTYVDLVCNLLDIPVYKSRIQSLHVLFTLYATYKHFNHYGPLAGLGEGMIVDENTRHDLDDGEVDRLQIN